jgi:hypothetical protein
MKNVNYINTFLIVFFWIHVVVGQNSPSFKGLKIECSINKLVKENNDLSIRIKLTNFTDTPILVYKDTYFGSLSDKDGAIDFEIQKENKGSYKKYLNRYSIDQFSDSKDTRKLNVLAQNDSLIVSYHLDNLYFFQPGIYRVKCFYRGSLHNDTIIKSSWIYFKVIKTIYIKHSYEY